MSERIEKIKELLIKSPDDLFLNHAMALEYIKAGNDSQAKEHFDKNLSHDPNYVATYYHLGKLLERTGETEQAINVYQQGMTVARQIKDNHSLSELRSACEELEDL